VAACPFAILAELLEIACRHTRLCWTTVYVFPSVPPNPIFLDLACGDRAPFLHSCGVFSREKDAVLDVTVAYSAELLSMGTLGARFCKPVRVVRKERESSALQ